MTNLDQRVVVPYADIQQLLNYIFEHEHDDFREHILNEDCKTVSLPEYDLADLDKAAVACHCHIYGCAIRVWQHLYPQKGHP